MSEEDARESENHWIETKLKKRIDLAFTDKPLIAYLICLSHSHNSSNNYFITCVCLFHFYRACSPLVRCSVSIVFLFLYKKWLFHNVSWRQLRQQFGPIRQQSIGRINRSKACFFTSQATMSRNFSPLPLPHSSMKIPLIWRRKFYSYFKLPCSICLKFNQITADCNEREGKAQLVNNQIAMLDCIWSI